ncbi:MAG: hypothetical protein NC489_11585 [Ruminococcus flavefaciens]|nr:hypothetical protein [Ruminococcus flavefaciens]
MMTRVINMDQWPEWNRKIFVDGISAAVIGINRDNKKYTETIATLRRIDVSHPLLIVTQKDYKKIFQDAENYESPPCIQVFSHSQNTGHYTVDEIINQTELTCEFITDDLK